MNYKKIYYQIIDNAIKREFKGYKEKHHIIPRSLGGTDEPENIVELTAKEHFICHLLLTKMYEEETLEWYKMIKAFMMMKSVGMGQERYTSRMYKYYRTRFSKAQSISQSGGKNSQHGTCWVYHNQTLESKRIDREKLQQYLKCGYNKGRVLDKKKFIERQKQKEYKKDIKLQNKRKRIQHAENLYDQYIKGKYPSLMEFCRDGKYSKTHEALRQLFVECIPEYSQNSKQGTPYNVKRC